MPSIYFKRQASVSFDIPFRAQRLLVKCYNSCNIKQVGQCILRSVRITIVAVEKLNYYIFWVCVCRLKFQHAMRVYRIVICGLPESTQFFLHIIP